MIDEIEKLSFARRAEKVIWEASEHESAPPEWLHTMFWKINTIRSDKMPIQKTEALVDEVHREIFDVLHIVL